MPPHAALTLRAKLHHGVLDDEVAPVHGHFVEKLIGVTAITVNIHFIIGSVFFLSWMSKSQVLIGDWIFIVGSFINVCLSLHAILELHVFNRVKSLRLIQASTEGRKLRNEFLENVFFLVAGSVFLAGSIFFMPGIYGKNEEAEERGTRAGAYLFIIGSFGFLFANFFSTIEMASDPEHQNFKRGSIAMGCHYRHVLGLMCALVGSVCFVVGSVLYRPLFSLHRSEAADAGTKFYIAGSVLYLVDSLLAFSVVLLKEGKDGADLFMPRENNVIESELGAKFEG